MMQRHTCLTGDWCVALAVSTAFSACALWHSGKGVLRLGQLMCACFPGVDAAACVSLSEALRDEVTFGYAAACAGSVTSWKCMLL